MTNRAIARQNVVDSVTEAATKSHQRNYHRLYIWRDGSVSWTEEVDRNTRLIDGPASAGNQSIKEVPSVTVTGVGDYACNCDHCNEVYSAIDEQDAADNDRAYDRDAKYTDHAEAIAAAVGDADLSDIEADMLRRLDEIPAGYFDGEKAA